MTDQRTRIAPVVKSVLVAADPGRAFEVFTAGMERWWPGDRHSVSAMRGDAPQQLCFEPRLGGAVWEVTPEGDRCDWGRVTLWQPGSAFEMTWHPGRAVEKATHLRVAFVSEGDHCRVTLTHSGWEVLGDDAGKARDSYDNGWNGVLSQFETAVQALGSRKPL